MAKFPHGGGGNMAGLLKQAQKMQDQMKKMQDEIASKDYEITTGGGAVKLTMQGTKTVKKIEIDKDILNEDDCEMLCDMLCAAFNEGTRQIDDETQSKMGAMTGGMNFPGM